MSEQKFAEIAVMLGVSQEHSALAYQKLRSRIKGDQSVLLATVIEELKRSFEQYTRQFLAQLEQQVTEIVKKIETIYEARLCDVIGEAEFNDKGRINKEELSTLMKKAYEKTSASDIKTILSFMKDEQGMMQISEIQDFLKKFTTLKKVLSLHNEF